MSVVAAAVAVAVAGDAGVVAVRYSVVRGKMGNRGGGGRPSLRVAETREDGGDEGGDGGEGAARGHYGPVSSYTKNMGATLRLSVLRFVGEAFVFFLARDGEGF